MNFLIHSQLPDGLTLTPKAYIPTVPAVLQQLGIKNQIKPIHPQPNKVMDVNFLAIRLKYFD